MLGLLNISLLAILLTFVVLCVSFFIVLWKHPPRVEINVKLPDELKLWLPDLIFPQFPALPKEFVVKHQHVPADVETQKPIDEPIPEDVLIYIEQESDTWAQEARKRRARMLKVETGSWDAAFRLLQREDNPNG